ncbi:MAG: DUF416 family protein [Bacteroidota bacterium]
MNWTGYNELLKSEINKSSEKQKLEFAEEICERLLPDYYNFVNETNWGDTNVISRAWKLIENSSEQPASTEIIGEMVIEVEKNTPDTEDFGQISGSLALNSCTAITETLKFILDKKPERIMDIASFSYDTIYFKVCELNPELSEMEIENQDEIQKEIEWQLRKLKK